MYLQTEKPADQNLLYFQKQDISWYSMVRAEIIYLYLSLE